MASTVLIAVHPSLLSLVTETMPKRVKDKGTIVRNANDIDDRRKPDLLICQNMATAESLCMIHDGWEKGAMKIIVLNRSTHHRKRYGGARWQGQEPSGDVELRQVNRNARHFSLLPDPSSFGAGLIRILRRHVCV